MWKHSSNQYSLVKTEPLSNTMSSGKPKSLNVCFSSRSASSGVLIVFQHMMNCASFMNRSTTTRTELYRFFSSPLKGRSVIKSMDIECQGPLGVGKGANNLCGLCVRDFIHWHVWHSWMYIWMSFFIDCHSYFCQSKANIFATPK